MSRLRRAAARALRSGPSSATARLIDQLAGTPPQTLAVLTYHRVDDPRARPWLYPVLVSAAPAQFELQMAQLERRYHMLTIEEVIAAMRGEKALPARSLLVTFDDGYRDFADVAWPILKRLGIPAVLFVPTAYPSNGAGAAGQFWWDRLWAVVANLAAGTPVATDIGVVTVTGHRSRLELARRLIAHYKSLPHDAAAAAVDAFCSQSDDEAPRNEILGWGELRQLASEGVHLAPHSRHHPLLTRVTHDVLRTEIEGSRQDLEARVGDLQRSMAFSYPAGAYDDQTVAAVGAAGFELAFTTDRGVNRLGRTDPLRLRRINVSPIANAGLLETQIIGGKLRLWFGA